MKKRILIEKIIERAHRVGIHDVQRMQGSNHELLMCRGIKVAIPRHNEINTFTAESIMKSLEPELGKDWWRNA